MRRVWKCAIGIASIPLKSIASVVVFAYSVKFLK